MRTELAFPPALRAPDGLATSPRADGLTLAAPGAMVTVTAPEGERLPLVVDSPHSGTWYPPDFAHACALARLREAEDTHVADLLDAAPAVGATLIAAQFPRSYIDPNRDLADLDPAMLAGPWPAPLQPSAKTAQGIGLIWRRIDCPPPAVSQPIYTRPLGIAEVETRIARCWQPYRDALDTAIARAQADFGRVWYIDGHSMQAVGAANAPDAGVRRADFCIGDRHGTTCGPQFRDLVVETLRAEGFWVSLNEPYAGVALVRRHGEPASGREALQLEINRALYMDEATRLPHPGYGAVKAALGRLLATVARHVRGEIRR